MASSCLSLLMSLLTAFLCFLLKGAYAFPFVLGAPPALLPFRDWLFCLLTCCCKMISAWALASPFSSMPWEMISRAVGGGWEEVFWWYVDDVGRGGEGMRCEASWLGTVDDMERGRLEGCRFCCAQTLKTNWALLFPGSMKWSAWNPSFKADNEIACMKQSSSGVGRSRESDSGGYWFGHARTELGESAKTSWAEVSCKLAWKQRWFFNLAEPVKQTESQLEHLWMSG